MFDVLIFIFLHAAAAAVQLKSIRLPSFFLVFFSICAENRFPNQSKEAKTRLIYINQASISVIEVLGDQ